MYAQNPPHQPPRAQARDTSRSFTALILLKALPAHALLLRACRPTDSPLFCRLESLLTLLYTAAAILAVLLILAILAAVRAYKRKGRKLRPEEITPDAP